VALAGKSTANSAHQAEAFYAWGDLLAARAVSARRTAGDGVATDATHQAHPALAQTNCPVRPAFTHASKLVAQL
jgi:hypothetical protein